MGMFDFLSRMLGKTTPTSSTRLTSGEAIAIARRAAAGDPHGDNLSLVKLDRSTGSAVWIVSSATVGSMLEISIDDATGEVLEKKHVGVR